MRYHTRIGVVIDEDGNLLFWKWSSFFRRGVCPMTVGRRDVKLSLIEEEQGR